MTALAASDGGVHAMLRGIAAEGDAQEAGEGIAETVFEAETAGTGQQLLEFGAAIEVGALLGFQVISGLAVYPGMR